MATTDVLGVRMAYGRFVLRRTGVLSCVCVVLVLTGLFGVDPAGAAITLGSPSHTGGAGIAVDTDGTAHVAWTQGAAGGDRLVWCRLPRGAAACAQTQVLIPDTLGSFGPVQVLIPSPGRVLLIQYRCCNERTILYESGDAGASWSGPRTIGTLQPSDAALGPGPFSVSLVDDTKTYGVDFQAAPIAGGLPGKADVGAGLPQVNLDKLQGYDGTVAFLDPSTPVVAFSDLNESFYSVWAGSGEYNATAAWEAATSLGPGSDTRLASGQSGVYVLYRTGKPGSVRVVARRMNPGTRAFGTPVTVSEVGDPLAPDLFEDGSGRLHAVWERNVGDALRYRSSTDGAAWSAARTLDTTAGGKFGLRAATAPDGGGWAVWDGNGKGPIRAAVIPVAGAAGGGTAGPGCPVTVKLTAKVDARARAGCLTKRADGTYASSGEVRVNGIDFQPSGATGAHVAGARSAAAGQVVVDPKAHVIKVTGQVDARAGNIVLHRGGLTWDVDQPVKFTKLDAFKVTLLGFPITGEADVTFLADGARVDANLRLPGYFGGVTGRTALRTKTADPFGLQLHGITIAVPEANIGALIVRNLKVSYDSDINTFEGKADFVFPPQTTRGVGVAFGFKDGQFAHAEAQVGPPVPPFPLPLTAPPGPLFLQRIGIAVSAQGGLRVAGGAALTLGPAFKGTGIVSIDALPPGGFVFDFPAGKGYADLAMTGKLKLVDVALAGGYVKYRTTGLLSWRGGLVLDLSGLVGITGTVDGLLNVATGAFNSSSKVKICSPTSCFIKLAGIPTPTPLQGTGTFVVSSKGAAGCVSVAGVGIGAGVLWGEAFDAFADGGCGLGDYQVSAGGSARLAQSGQTGVTFPDGLPEAGIKLRGDSAPPVVTVTGPKGEALTIDPARQAVVQPPFVAYTVPEAKLTVIQIARPSAGRWTIMPQAGSPQITEVRSARGLPAVRVSGRVTGHGRNRSLQYRLGSIAGQRVTFFERSTRALARIGTAGTASGTLPFAPAEGPAGTRRIVALVEQDGRPRAERVLASYTAPPPARPGRPRVRIARTTGAAVVTWPRVADAARYTVRVRFTAGRVVQATTTATRRRVVIRGVQRTDGARASVTAVTSGGLGGRPGIGRLRRG